MSETEQTPENDIQFSPGSLLKQAREQADISIEDVMRKLKLTRQTITAIENDDYSGDLPATFYRGYLRNYAELLKMNDNDIVENFDNFCKRNNLFNKNEQSLATIELEKPITSNNWVVKIVTGIVILILLLGAYYLLVEKKVWQDISTSLFSGQETENLPLENQDNNLLPISSQAAGSQQQDELPISRETDSVDLAAGELSSEDLATEAMATETNTSPEASTEPATTSPSSDGTVGQLELVFSADCWVRITDANGKVLALGIKKGGTSLSLSGPAPIELTLGKASAVQLSYQNEPIDLSSYPDSRAARLTLGN